LAAEVDGDQIVERSYGLTAAERAMVSRYKAIVDRAETVSRTKHRSSAPAVPGDE